VEVSRVPPSLISNAAENWRHFPNLLIEMRKRGIKPRIDLVKTIPYLGKERPSGLSYLQSMAQVMAYPIMGHDLGDIAKELWADCPNPLRTLMYSAAVYQVLSGMEKMKQSMDYIEQQFRLSHQDKVVLEEVGDIDDFSNEDIWSPEGTLHRIACVQNNQPQH